MYCEKCSRIIDSERCPCCRSRKVRAPETGDICFLTEQDYVSSGILEDVLKQEGIPYMIKNVLGAGLSIRVGPMLDRSRFYVPWKYWENAETLVNDLFSAPGGNGESAE